MFFLSFKSESLPVSGSIENIFVKKQRQLQKALQKIHRSYGGWKANLFAVFFILCFILLFQVGIKYILMSLLDDTVSKRLGNNRAKACFPSAGYDITICSMIKNDVPYLLEWIIFHKMQGVNHFVLYDDQSSDGLPLVENLLEQAGENDLVEVIPASVPIFEMRWHDGSIHEFRYSQGSVLNHCMAYMKNQTKWLLMIDIDEFVFSMSASTLVAELNTAAYRGIPFIHLKDIRFGSNGVQKQHNVSFYMSETMGKVKTNFSPSLGSPIRKNKEKYPLVIETHSRRMSTKELDSSTIMLDHRCYLKNGSVSEECRSGNGKTLMRSGSCSSFLNHFCLDATNGKLVQSQTLHANPRTQIRLYHFFIRSAEFINKIPAWKYSKNSSYHMFDNSVYSTVYDDYLGKKYAAALRKNIQHLIS